MHWQLNKLSNIIPNFPSRTNVISSETLNYTLQYIKYLQDVQLAYNFVCGHFKVNKHTEFAPKNTEKDKINVSCALKVYLAVVY